MLGARKRETLSNNQECSLFYCLSPVIILIICILARTFLSDQMASKLNGEVKLHQNEATLHALVVQRYASSTSCVT